MTFNPFEQLQFVSIEPRQAFEDAAAAILRATIPSTRRVRVHQGDGGVDLFEGTYGPEGSVDVYQIKYFPGLFDDSRKQQIRESYKTARASQDFNLRKWILCVPIRLTKSDIHWFDTWSDGQDKTIELMDGDDLTDLLQREECAGVRQQFGNWGIAGMRAGGPRLKAGVFIRPADAARTGLTFYLGVLLYNEGDRTARNVSVEIKHDETNCVSHATDVTLWQDESPGGRLNPRKLRCKQNINPGEKLVVMGIPVVDRTIFPFSVVLTISAEDMQMECLRATIEPKQLVPEGWVPFDQQGSVSIEDKPAASRPQPTNPASRELLEAILENPDPNQRGLTEILEGDPGNSLNAAFLFTTEEFGQHGVHSMRKRIFREGVEELLRLGWLLQPEMDDKTAIYEFGPE